MIKPDFEDIQLSKFKMISKTKVEVTFAYMYSMGNDGHLDSLKITRDLSPHKSLYDLLVEMKPVVMEVEGFSSALKYANIDGSENDKLIANEIEGKRRDIMSRILITGFSISGDANVVITFNMMTSKGKCAGRSTVQIDIEQNVYGIEENLKDIITEILPKVYEYVYEDKYMDSDQYDLGLFELAVKIGDSDEIKEEIEQEPPKKEKKKK
jgi:hypothetical protein